MLLNYKKAIASSILPWRSWRLGGSLKKAIACKTPPCDRLQNLLRSH
ncbi:MAG: hypothetical protein V7K35_01735 [Nostoc sp.]